MSGVVQTIIKNVGKEVRKTDCCCNGSAPSNLDLLVGSGLDFRLGFRQFGNRKQLKTRPSALGMSDPIVAGSSLAWKMI